LKDGFPEYPDVLYREHIQAAWIARDGNDPARVDELNEHLRKVYTSVDEVMAGSFERSLDSIKVIDGQISRASKRREKLTNTLEQRRISRSLATTPSNSD
jgi:hypothetical protein